MAMISEQMDVAWMGSWGYVWANDASEVLTGSTVMAIATVKYDERPIYQKSAVKPLPSGMGFTASVLCFFC